MRLSHSHLVVTSLAVLTLLCGACKRSATYSSKDGSVNIEQKGKDATSMTFTGEDGQKVTLDTGGGKLPDDYPKDVPLYKDVKVILSQTVSQKNAKHLILESPDAAGKIADFYKNALDSGGWKTEGGMTMGEMTMVTATRENRQLVIQITNADNKRNISQILSDK